jgi:hypothetical protein
MRSMVGFYDVGRVENGKGGDAQLTPSASHLGQFRIQQTVFWLWIR